MRHAFVALFLLAACASASAPTDLAGTHWTSADSNAERPPTIEFSDDGAAGFAGCNRWFASVLGTVDDLHFEAIGSTKMACPGPAMDVERAFLGALGRTRGARVDGDTLSFVDDAGAVIARFNRAP